MRSINRMGRPRVRKLALAAVLVAVAMGCAGTKSKGMKADQAKETVTCTTYSAEVRVEQPPEAVFNSIREWEYYQYAIPRASLTMRSGPRINGLGDHMGGRVNGLVANLPWQAVVTRYELNRRMTISFSEGLRGSVTCSLIPLEGGAATKMVYSVHLFFPQDTAMGQALAEVINQGSGALADTVDRLITDGLRLATARLNGQDPATFKLEVAPRYEVFQDSFFVIEDRLRTSPKKTFERFARPEEIAALLPFERLEPVGDSPADAVMLGSRYRGVSRPELGARVEYDVIPIQLSPGKEARYMITAADVMMEVDLQFSPALTGANVRMLFMIDLPAEQSGQTLDVIIQTSSVDKFAQARVQELKQRGLTP
jgi:hypothetical protein